ncbi:hypothetical protein DFH29DRAFT_883759, partial [Suillus ampliporus]
MCFSPWLQIGLPLVLLLFMVTISLRCNAMGCSWAKETDPRGLSRHRATCRKYQKASTLATEKRRERAKESIQLSQKLTTSISPLQPVRFIKDHCTKPIAYCKPKAFTGKSKAPTNAVNPTSNAAVTASAFSALQGSDVAMADATEGDYNIP